MNKPFSLLVKPASADCNLNCCYCFYLEKCALYPQDKHHRMQEAVLERMIESYMGTDQPVYTFGWQGGEPTLMGTDFFRKVTALQQKHGKKGAQVANGLQTNATLIDDEMAALFAEYKFLLGVSLDGPLDVHDHYRKARGHLGSFDGVWKGINTLKRHQVEFNILTLINNVNGSMGREVYTYLRDSGFMYHQYIPCVEYDNNGQLMSYAVNGDQWGDFLCSVFDEWIQKDAYKVSVRLFDGLLSLMVQGRYTICHMAGNCCQYFVVEHNGDVYPCDFFVREDTCLGNVADKTWQGFLDMPAYHAFGAEKSKWPAPCRSCPYLLYCSGDCLKHRRAGQAGPEPSSLCSGWKRFYDHAVPRLKEEADKLIQGNSGPGTRSKLLSVLDMGRNEACFCGSGRKFKKCHGTAL